MKEEGVSICITAYKAKDFIKECLDSVANQSWFRTHDNWEIIVGIDGCEETLEYVKTIMGNYKNLRVLMMDCNKGTYITSNTIMTEAKYEHLFRFDSDDIMCSNLVETVMNNKGNCTLVRYRLQDFGDDKNEVSVAHGTIYIKKSTFIKYGGFRPWPCGADTEIYHRLMKIEKVKNIRNILMLRRVHDSSLTRSKDTGYKSELRNKYKKIIKDMVISKPSDAIIHCEKNTYKEIFSEIPGVDKDTYMKNIKQYSVKDVKVKPEDVNKPKNKTVNAIKKLREDIYSQYDTEFFKDNDLIALLYHQKQGKVQRSMQG